MPDLLPEIRNAARALIVQRDRVLLIRKEGGGRGERFALPGGAQDPGETLEEALNRECLEEIGTSVDVGDLVHVADFFKRRDTTPPTRRHLVEFVFRCSLPEGYSPRNGPRPDRHQVGVVWAGVSELGQMPLFPNYLSACIAHHGDPGVARYLGAFHDHAAAKEY
jgi:ADP-ribose pyrophosphatase YjhB (NUDIX family)